MNVPISPNYLFYLLHLWGFLSHAAGFWQLVPEYLDLFYDVTKQRGRRHGQPFPECSVVPK